MLLEMSVWDHLTMGVHLWSPEYVPLPCPLGLVKVAKVFGEYFQLSGFPVPGPAPCWNSLAVFPHLVDGMLLLLLLCPPLSEANQPPTDQAKAVIQLPICEVAECVVCSCCVFILRTPARHWVYPGILAQSKKVSP